MKFSLSAFLLLLIVSPGFALAQGFSVQSLEFTLSEGISSFTKKDFQIGPPQSSTPIDLEMKFDTSNRHDARLNFLTTNRIGTEAFYSYGTTNVIFDRSTPPSDSLSVRLQLHHFGINVLYYPLGSTDSKWRPYVNVGGGALIYRPTASGQEAATDPLRGNVSTFIESSRGAINYGGGIKRTIGRSFGVRFDVGAVTTAVPTFGLPESSDLPNASVLPVSGRVNNLQASIGIILFLGK